MGNICVVEKNKSTQTENHVEEKESQTINNDVLELSSSTSSKKKSVSFTDETDGYKHSKQKM